MAIEELNVTEEQKSFCDEDESCLYDLVVTGDEEVASLTQEASVNSTDLQIAISEERNEVFGLLYCVLLRTLQGMMFHKYLVKMYSK